MKTGKTLYSNLSEYQKYLYAVKFLKGLITARRLMLKFGNDYWAWYAKYYVPLASVKNSFENLMGSTSLGLAGARVLSELGKITFELIIDTFSDIYYDISTQNTNETVKFPKNPDKLGVFLRDFKKKVYTDLTSTEATADVELERGNEESAEILYCEAAHIKRNIEKINALYGQYNDLYKKYKEKQERQFNRERDSEYLYALAAAFNIISGIL